MIWLLLFVIAVAVVPFGVERTRRTMNDKARDPAPGQFAALSMGVTHYRWIGPVTLFGYSMGGAIASSYAAAHPDRMRQLILLAPAGMPHSTGGLVAFMRKWRGIGDWLMLALYPRAHRKGIAAEAHLTSSVPNITELQERELAFRGFVPAVLSSLRGLLSRGLKPEHRAIAAANLPTLAIWGRDDAAIPLPAMGKLSEWNRDAEHQVIDGAGHGLAYTHSDEILAILSTRLLR